MKRLLTAIVLAALIVTVYVLELNLLKTSVTPMISKVDDAMQLFTDGQHNAAAKKISELNKMWNKSKDKISLFVDHCEIDEVDVLVARLSGSDGADYGSHTMAECRELKSALRTIVDNEAPSLINVA